MEAVSTVNIVTGKDEPLSSKTQLDGLRNELELDRSNFIPHWRDISDFILPRRARFSVKERNKAEQYRNHRIINNTATLAARTLRGGMMSGLTSPARPWFKLSTGDPDLDEFRSVKEWLTTVRRRMLSVFAQSNVYQALPVAYGDNGTFATAALIVVEDKKDVIRCYPQPIGLYCLGNDERMRAAVFTRELEYTVRQVVRKFGYQGNNNIDWSNISGAVKTQWDAGNYEQLVKMYHVIAPNEVYDENKLAAKWKKFKSVYYEAATMGIDADKEKFLKESGFDEFPVMGPRWEVTGEDSYGTECPGMTCLGDVKALQVMEKRKAQAHEKQVNPPMTGPASLKNSKASIIAGDITYLDVREGQKGFAPAHEIRYDTKGVMMDIEETQRRIQRAYYEDLFLMLTMSDRREITAREVEERHEEKLLMLGPVLERQNDELLDPLINRTFNIMVKRNMIPEAPPELEGRKLEIEYISILAQAQKAVGTAGVERLATFAGRVAEVQSTGAPAADKIDWDQTIDEYGEMLGVDPSIIRPDEEVAEMREAREAAIEEERQMAMLEQAANITGNVGSEQPPLNP